MNPSLSDSLAALKPKLDFSSYGKLPSKKEIQSFADTFPSDKTKELQLLWNKLNHIRKHLRIINDYLDYAAQNNHKIDVFSVWCENKYKDDKRFQSIDDTIITQIGNYDNSTEGIRVYFLKLEQIYDDFEMKFNQIECELLKDLSLHNEAKKKGLVIPVDNLLEVQSKRVMKSKERKEIRNQRYKHLRKDKKGYFILPMPTPEIGNEKKAKEPIYQEHYAASGENEPSPVNPLIKPHKNNIVKMIFIFGGISLAIFGIVKLTKN